MLKAKSNALGRRLSLQWRVVVCALRVGMTTSFGVIKSERKEKMEYLKIACGIIAWVALCFGGCALMVWIISKCPKEGGAK